PGAYAGPAPTATPGTTPRATGSTVRWARTRVRRAGPTRAPTCASTVSRPTRTASSVTAPSPFSVPAITAIPGPFPTRVGSPVSIDSSTVVVPSRITPSTGIGSPGRTPTPAPNPTASTGRASSPPSART